MAQKRCHYEVLQVSRSASPEQIADAYRKLAKQYHPDWNPDDPTTSEQFKRITKAYDVLSDPKRRAKYDEKLARRARAANTAPEPPPVQQENTSRTDPPHAEPQTVRRTTGSKRKGTKPAASRVRDSAKRKERSRQQVQVRAYWLVKAYFKIQLPFLARAVLVLIIVQPLLILGSFFWYGEETKQIVYQQNSKTGRLLVHTILMHHWKDLETNETFQPVVAELIKYFDKDDYDWSVIRPEVNHPNDSQKPKDAFERLLLARWSHPVDGTDTSISSNPPYADREQEVELKSFGSNGKPYDRKTAEFQYYQPVYLTSGTCVICHRSQNGNQDLSEGDLQAIIKVRIPLAQTQAAINRNWAFLLATAIITVFLAMIQLYVILRYLVWPLSLS